MDENSKAHWRSLRYRCLPSVAMEIVKLILFTIPWVFAWVYYRHAGILFMVVALCAVIAAALVSDECFGARGTLVEATYWVSLHMAMPLSFCCSLLLFLSRLKQRDPGFVLLTSKNVESVTHDPIIDRYVISMKSGQQIEISKQSDGTWQLTSIPVAENFHSYVTGKTLFDVLRFLDTEIRSYKPFKGIAQ